MFKSFRLLAVAAFAGSSLFGLLAAPSQSAAQTAPRVGYVDIAKVSEDAEPVKAAYKELNELQASYTRFLQELDQYTYLNAAELQEFTAILETTGELTPAQKLRSGELKKQAADREKQWQELAVVTNPTPEQKKQMDQLAAYPREHDRGLEELSRKYQEKLNEKAKEILPKLTKMVDDVIEALGKEQKFTLILSKKVQGGMGPEDVVLFGGEDITAEVVKRLNAKK